MRAKRQKIMGEKEFEEMVGCEGPVLAMLIDTEGCIYAAKSHDYYVPEITVEMASLMPITTAQKWGGYVYKRSPVGKHKRSYRWQVLPEHKRAFLKKVKPYLQLKREQAENAVKMLDVWENKAQGWKLESCRLAAHMRILNDSEPPDIDLEKT